jgi:NAD(P)-dependent dehydrogenase (short-subunit alcohol dehydrogenase family)
MIGKNHWTTASIPDQSGRVAIVTGSNSGIGYETAKVLAHKGATVVLACRNEARGNEAVGRIRGLHPDATVELILLDLASLESIGDFDQAFRKGHQRLDLLINNAGIMMPAERSMTSDGFELQLGVNHLGHFALTGLLLDRLLATDGSRVVNVASGAHHWGEIDFDDLHWERKSYKKVKSYGQSKLANLLFTAELQRRLKKAGAGTSALAAHPGWTATNLQDENPLIRFLNPLLAMKPWQGALPTLYAATADEARPGEYYGPGGLTEMRGYPSVARRAKNARNREDAARLWGVSEKLVGIEYDAL